MRAIRLLKLAVLFAAALPVLASGQNAPKPDTTRIDLNGKWNFSVQSDVGSGTPVVTFVQKGDSLTGRYSSQTLGERDFVGTYKAGKIEFSVTAEAGGQTFTMTFSGAANDRDTISGSIDFAGMATGTFVGKRVKP